MGNSLTPVQDIVEADGKLTINTSTTFRTSKLEFALDTEFSETTIDGRDVQSKVVMEDGGVLVHTQRGKDGAVISTIKRWLEEDGKLMVMTLEAPVEGKPPVVATRKYSRQG